MEYKFGTAGEIYKLAHSMHAFGMPGDEIAMTIRQTLELRDEPVDDKEIQRLVAAAISQADGADVTDDTDDRPDCSECEWNPLSMRNLCRKPKQVRLLELKDKALREGTDPVFKALIEHAGSYRTSRSIDVVFFTLMRALDADSLHVDVDRKNYTLRVTVESGGPRYTSTTEWDDDETTVRAYDATYDADSSLLEDLDLTDSYSTKRGTLVANGHWTGGESYGN